MENGNTATDTATEEKPATAQDYFGYEPIEVKKEDAPKEVVDYQAEVNRLLKETKVTEDGKFEYPENTPAWARVAIANEKKFRDTQTSFTKIAQEKKVLEAELEALRSKLEAKASLTPEQQEELETLKTEDPDAYFEKRTQYEAEASQKFNDEIKEVKTKTAEELELERRQQYLNEFNSKREKPINNDVIENEVPAKYLRELEEGKVTFEQFLANVAEFVDAPKVVGKKEEVTNVTNLSKLAGGTEPSKEKQYDNIAEEYASIVF
jgi:hypothetical protein